MIKARKRVLYQFESEGRKVWVEFVKLKTGSTPLFTHRVVLDGQAVGWLADTHKPNLRSARYFYDKHVAAAR